MMDEIFEFEQNHDVILKFKRVTTVSPEIWQMYNPDFRKWVIVKYDTINSYFQSLIQERKVLTEKRKYASKQES